MNQICPYCQEEFKIKRNKQKYCSRKCSSNGSRAQQILSKSSRLGANKMKRDEKQQVIEDTKFLNYIYDNVKLKQRIWHLKNSDYTLQKCQCCLNPAKFIHTYYTYCSDDCKSIGVTNNIRQTNLERYGVAFAGQRDDVKEKIKATNLERYGVENVMHSKDICEKMKKIMNEKYGCDSPFESIEIQEKIKATNLERYGVENPFGRIDIQEKIKVTNLERYGFENPAKCQSVKDKAYQTNMERYGSQIHHGFKYKEYILPSGKIVKIQGYENRALDDLLETYDEADLVIGRKEIKKHIGNIQYELNGTRTYYPDIYIISENKVIEVKSTWTYKIQREKNELKKQACLNKDLLFEFIIYK